MLKSLRFRNWAQPVTSRPWAVICSVLFAASRATGFRVLNRAKHRAWQHACGLA
jgi:hypothetical protein